jgi:hypothetical protein
LREFRGDFRSKGRTQSSPRTKLSLAALGTLALTAFIRFADITSTEPMFSALADVTTRARSKMFVKRANCPLEVSVTRSKTCTSDLADLVGCLDVVEDTRMRVRRPETDR